MLSNFISKKPNIRIYSLFLTVFIFINLLFQEDAFNLNVRGTWIYVADMCILFLGLFELLIQKKKFRFLELKENLRFLIPFVVVTLYSIFLNFFTHKTPLYISINTGLYWIIPILVGIVVGLNMGIFGIYIIYNAVLLNYTCVVAKCISVNGISYLFKWSTYSENYGSLLEVHPIGLALPLFLIFFLFRYYQDKVHLKWTFWIGVLYTFMCGKRIALLGIVVVFILYHILSKTSKKFEKKQLNFFMLLFFILAFVYLLLVKYDIIESLAHIAGIDTMSRVETWDALKTQYHISPLFLGNGVGFSTYYLHNIDGVYIYGYINKVGDVHNDILKTYIDAGFLMFIFYMWFLFISNLRFFLRKCCIKSALLYFLLISYTFILMFCDNIMRYDLYLLALFAIPMTYKRKEENDKRLLVTRI